jgi:nicotinate dehydrogenase subunit A
VSATQHPTLRFTVNGRPQALRVRPSTPLLYVLRNELGLSATRHGCGQGLCGACVVQVDGRAVFSCDTPAWQIAGTHVTTLEGLCSDRPHPLLEAFIAEQAAQCGYCVSGIVMRAHALLRENTNPSRVQIAQALERHLCRCGAQPRMLRAIESAAAILRDEAAPATSTTKPPQDGAKGAV